ncbi:MAG: UxaA family hydrolase, partial [Succinivibrio sp.]|nr:UxaA family hydrolase [Succinivibrio sp.]
MQCVVINPGEDVVAVALEDLKAGQTVKTAKGDVTLKDDITRGHKFALYDLKEGDQIIKYGYSIGHATCPIQKGQHVHSENVNTNLSGTKDYTYNRVEKTQLKKVERTFEGYVRADGQVGIRTEVWIIPTVFCVNHIAKELETYAREKLETYSNVDGCYALTHPYGCSQMG